MGEPVTMPDGRVIRDLTDEEYDATYHDAGVDLPKIPDDVMGDAIARLGKDD